MPLPIRDGNQSLTTLSTILVSNAHIPAHTVVSLGTQAITDIATAVSGVELGPNTLNALENITVTLGQVTITGGLTDAQLRASAVTIGGSVTASISGTPSVTFGTAVVTGSTSILNFPATQTVTFSQAPVTFGTAVITGSTSILNFPATQTVTFGTSVITGSVSVLNIPATQTVTFTQASVTFSQPTITGSVSVLNFPASQSVTFTTATVTFGTAVITGSTSIIGTPSITFGLIAGTVTANPTGTQTIGGTVTANVPVLDQSIRDGILLFNQTEGNIQVAVNYAEPITGTVTANGFDSVNGISKTIPVIRCDDGIAYNSDAVPVAIAIESGSVNTANPLPISGTVTIGALPSGALTTRFGSITTAGTAQITSAVTNTSRKYLLAQNISSSAVTIGIGFSPTTTQGIQLNAGAGLTFDAFCPTGAVYWLGSVTGASFTILEG
jgi:hypothetical protein